MYKAHNHEKHPRPKQKKICTFEALQRVTNPRVCAILYLYNSRSLSRRAVRAALRPAPRAVRGRLSAAHAGREEMKEFSTLQMEEKRRAERPSRPRAKTTETDTALVWGRNPVTELLKKDGGVDTLLLADSMEPRMAGYFTALGKTAGAVIKRVPAGRLQKLCGTDEHQGVAAWAARIEYTDVDALLRTAAERGEPPFLVLCDGVEDPHNLGAILRSALLCGAHGVIIPRRGGVGVTGTVMKASAGAAARIPVARVANLAQTIRELKERNVFVYCADLGGTPLEQTDLSGPVALVLGSEGAGPGTLVRRLCDGAVTLSMAGGETGVDSYNVSVAAGILMYHIMQGRTDGGW